jgi:hypothetical protein
VAVALEFAASLGDLLVWAGAFMLAALMLYMVVGIARGLEAILGAVPLVGDIASSFVHGAASPIISELDNLRAKSDAEMAKALSFLADSLAIGFGLAVLLGLGVKLAFEYLWHHALQPLIHAIVRPVAAVAQEALGRVLAVPRQIETALGQAEGFATAEAAEALRVARGYAAEVAGVAETNAERFANEAIAKLRALEDGAVAGATRLANEGIAAAAAAETTAVSTSEAFATATVDAAVGAIDTTLDGLGLGLKGVEDWRKLLEAAAGVGGLGLLIAALPNLLAFVNSLATDAGLANKECRNKVGKICQTNPAQWEGLLAGLVPLGFAFSLHELAALARPLISELEPLIKKAA